MSVFNLRCGFAILALALGCQALAQNPPVVTDADIERARRETPTVTDQDVEAARRKYSMPGAADLQAMPAPISPNVEALPQPLSRTPIDLEALARGYAAQTDAISQAQGLATGPGLLVFVSLSMPQPSLQRLIDQAARAKASVLIRGLVGGSLRQTVAQVQGLIGTRQVSVQIDPQAFDRFSITRVPSLVLVRDGIRPASCATGTCAPPEDFVRAAGDVSLDYALEYIQRTTPRFSKDAAGFLKRIKG